MKKIRIGHIGTYHDHSGQTLATLRLMPDIFEVVGYVPESEKRYNEIKTDEDYIGIPKMSFEELVKAGIDAAVVEGYELDSVKAAILCIENGIPVHLDKPGGNDIKLFETLMNKAKEKNLTVQMGYMYRYNPMVKKAMKAINAGEIGDVYAVEAHMNCQHDLAKREWLGNFPGGMMFFLGCHLVDLILSIQGLPDEIIPLNTSTGIGGVTSKDYGMAVFKYKNGVSFAKTCDAEVGGFARRQLVVCGTKGTIEINPLERYYARLDLTSEMSIVRDEEIHGSWLDLRKKEASEPFNRYRDMLSDFAACVRGEKQNDYSYEYEIKLQKVFLAACGMKIDFRN